MSNNAPSSMAQFLREHPRMMGVLFTVAVLLTQATPVLAGSSCSTCSG